MKTKKLYLLVLLGSISINLYAQDIQRFLGTYYLEVKGYEYVHNYPFFSETIVVIKEGIKYDLLIEVGSVDNLDAFILNDSLFILPVIRDNIFDGTQWSFYGEGKIRNDSLFLSYGSSGSFGSNSCEGKGGKTKSSYGGIITYRLNPNLVDVEEEIFALEGYSGDFIFTINSQYISSNSKLIVDGVEYFREDMVRATGIISRKEGLRRPYNEFEIKTIEKMSFNTVATTKSNNKKVYYNAAQQAIVIDETLQNQLSAFELMDLQGRVLLKQTNSGGTSIGMANLPDGVYLYRLLLKNRETYFGKIIKYD